MKVEEKKNICGEQQSTIETKNLRKNLLFQYFSNF